MAPSSLLALGPNPALQRVMAFDSFKLGEVNRAASLSQYVGGKGQGVALALQRWAPGESAIIAHFLGGDTGSFVEAEMQARKVEQITQRVAAPTRICTTLLHGEDVTELIDPSGTVSEAECAGLLTQIDAALPRCKGVAFCGTSPPGAGNLYLRVAEQLAKRDAELSLTLMLDGYKGIEPVLQTGRVDVLKLNAFELQQLTGASTVDDAAASLLRARDAPLKRDGALVAVTDGPRPARLYSAERSWTLSVPQITVTNAIGAGDVCTAVFLHALTQPPKAGETAHAADAFAWGLAAGCARCLQELPAFEVAKVHEMRKGIVIEES